MSQLLRSPLSTGEGRPLAILACAQWPLPVASHLPFLDDDEPEQVFLCLAALCIFSVCCWQFSLFKKLGYSFSRVLRILYIVWIHVFLSDIWFANIFSKSVACLSSSKWCLSKDRSFWLWQSPIYSFSSLTLCAFYVVPKKSLQRISLILSFKGFLVSAFMFNTMIHFRLVFVHGT